MFGVIIMKKIILLFFILSFIIIYSKEYKIGVIPKSMYTEFWKNIEAGAKVAAKEEGVTLIYRGPTYDENEKIQKEIIMEMIRMNVDAIVIAPADKKIVSDEINIAIKKGIKVIIIDSSIADVNYDCYIATDNYRAGKTAAEKILKLSKNRDKIMVLKFKKGNGSTDEREQGFKDGIKENGFEVNCEEYAGTSPRETVKNIEQFLKKYKPKLIFASNGTITAGVVSVIKKIGNENIVIVGFDMNEEIRDAIKNGYISGVIAQNPYKIGYTGIKKAVELLDGKKVEKEIMIECEFITK